MRLILITTFATILVGSSVSCEGVPPTQKAESPLDQVLELTAGAGVRSLVYGMKIGTSSDVSENFQSVEEIWEETGKREELGKLAAPVRTVLMGIHAGLVFAKQFGDRFAVSVAEDSSGQVLIIAGLTSGDIYNSNRLSEKQVQIPQVFVIVTGVTDGWHHFLFFR